MENRIEENRREFDKIIDVLKHMGADSDIQKSEEEIFSRLGRILMEFSTTMTFNVCKIPLNSAVMSFR